MYVMHYISGHFKVMVHPKNEYSLSKEDSVFVHSQWGLMLFGSTIPLKYRNINDIICSGIFIFLSNQKCVNLFMCLCVGGDGKLMLPNEHLTLVVLHLVCVLLWWAAN